MLEIKEEDPMEIEMDIFSSENNFSSKHFDKRMSKSLGYHDYKLS